MALSFPHHAGFVARTGLRSRLRPGSARTIVLAEPGRFAFVLPGSRRVLRRAQRTGYRVMIRKTAIAALAIGAAFGLSGCVDDYGYGGVGVGYAAAPGYYGDGPYDGGPYAPGYPGYGYGDDYGYGFGGSYFGWYGDYYYPGSGIYVYDRYRRPYRWNGDQQRYWNGRQQYRGTGYTGRGNWGGFQNRGGVRTGGGGGYHGNGGGHGGGFHGGGGGHAAHGGGGHR